jgi:hypothetical protein
MADTSPPVSAPPPSATWLRGDQWFPTRQGTTDTTDAGTPLVGETYDLGIGDAAPDGEVLLSQVVMQVAVDLDEEVKRMASSIGLYKGIQVTAGVLPRTFTIRTTVKGVGKTDMTMDLPNMSLPYQIARTFAQFMTAQLCQVIGDAALDKQPRPSTSAAATSTSGVKPGVANNTISKFGDKFEAFARGTRGWFKPKPPAAAVPPAGPPPVSGMTGGADLFKKLLNKPAATKAAPPPDGAAGAFARVAEHIGYALGDLSKRAGNQSLRLAAGVEKDIVAQANQFSKGGGRDRVAYMFLDKENATLSAAHGGSFINDGTTTLGPFANVFDATDFQSMIQSTYCGVGIASAKGEPGVGRLVHPNLRRLLHDIDTQVETVVFHDSWKGAADVVAPILTFFKFEPPKDTKTVKPSTGVKEYYSYGITRRRLQFVDGLDNRDFHIPTGAAVVMLCHDPGPGLATALQKAYLPTWSHQELQFAIGYSQPVLVPGCEATLDTVVGMLEPALGPKSIKVSRVETSLVVKPPDPSKELSLDLCRVPVDCQVYVVVCVTFWTVVAVQKKQDWDKKSADMVAAVDALALGPLDAREEQDRSGAAGAAGIGTGTGAGL